MAAYLFIYFTSDKADRESIWFSVSRDGLHWNDLGSDKYPVLESNSGTRGIRDPYIVYDERLEEYFIIATDLKISGGCSWDDAVHRGSRSILVWKSKDLINWSDEELIKVGIPQAGCVWAPEAIYCKEKNAWFVFWASAVQNSGDSEAKQRIYGAFTSDFKHFSDTFMYMEASTDVIDTDIVWSDGWYYRFSKDETNKVIMLEKCQKLVPDNEHEYFKVNSELLSKLEGLEGPEAYYLDEQKKWCLIADQYRTNSGYVPMVTDDLSSGAFVKLSEEDYDMGQRKKRHGGVLSISEDAADKLIKHFGRSV